MWIALNTAFLSIVQAKPSDYQRYRDSMTPAQRDALPSGSREMLAVRARTPNELRKVLVPYSISAARVVEWPGRDYPARVFLPRALVQRMIADAIGDIRYMNFKDSVKDRSLHDAYMDVWSAMNRYGNGLWALCTGKMGRRTALQRAPRRVKARPLTKAENDAHNARVQADIEAVEHDELFGYGDLRAR